MRHDIRFRIRVVREDGSIVMGPGKADLLEAIEDTGSIRASAEELGMSYMRAWTLVRTMNHGFTAPLVERVRGGSEQGGATLTRLGRSVLRSYRSMERKARTAVGKEWRSLRRYTR
ncbi:MAG TPA: LysR family transcriptional regulator [Thermoanaerobaculia bacterium]|nr:LysR family transcriptional regulator [Thermoanaerobaculia bacterium]